MENEVIKSLLEEKEKLENEFTELEAQAKNIEVGKERIRGAYIVIISQLKKFGVIKDEEPQQEQPKQEAVKEVDTPKETTKPKKTVEKKTEKKEEKKEKVVAGLTPEEIERINKAVTKPGAKDENGNEIPEYLQPEYNK